MIESSSSESAEYLFGMTAKYDRVKQYIMINF